MIDRNTYLSVHKEKKKSGWLYWFPMNSSFWYLVCIGTRFYCAYPHYHPLALLFPGLAFNSWSPTAPSCFLKSVGRILKGRSLTHCKGKMNRRDECFFCSCRLFSFLFAKSVIYFPLSIGMCAFILKGAKKNLAIEFQLFFILELL